MIAFLEHFFNFDTFGSILAAQGSLWVPVWLHVGPCWSIWLHFAVLKPTLRPTPPKNNSYSFLSIVLDFGLFFNRFQQICASCVIQTCITFLLSFFIFTRNPTTPNPTTPHTHKHKNMARRNARFRPESATPSRDEACQTTFGPKISDSFKFWVHLFPFKKSSEIRLQNLKQLISDSFLPRF